MVNIFICLIKLIGIHWQTKYRFLNDIWKSNRKYKRKRRHKFYVLEMVDNQLFSKNSKLFIINLKLVLRWG